MEDELNMIKDILYKYALVEVPSMENEPYIPESNFEGLACTILRLIRKMEIEARIDELNGLELCRRFGDEYQKCVLDFTLKTHISRLEQQLKEVA